MKETLLQIVDGLKRFGGLCAVNNVSLEIEKESIHALIGPNGSGKTTLLNLISGLYTLSGGNIFLEGKQLNGLPPHLISRLGVGRTFQNIRLFHELTVLQNVMVSQHHLNQAGLLSTLLLSQKARQTEKDFREKAMESLDLVGLGDLADLYVSGLPYGKKRLVELARALAMQPQLLMLDEPSAGLNPTETLELMERIRSINQQSITIFLVEHNMRLVMGLANRITVLDFGRKIAEGTPDEIKNNPAVIEAYLGSDYRHEGKAQSIGAIL